MFILGHVKGVSPEFQRSSFIQILLKSSAFMGLMTLYFSVNMLFYLKLMFLFFSDLRCYQIKIRLNCQYNLALYKNVRTFELSNGLEGLI